MQRVGCLLQRWSGAVFEGLIPLILLAAWLLQCILGLPVYVEIQRQRRANNKPWRPCVPGRSRINYPRALVMCTIGDWRPIDLDHYARGAPDGKTWSVSRAAIQAPKVRAVQSAHHNHMKSMTVPVPVLFRSFSRGLVKRTGKWLPVDKYRGTDWYVLCWSV